MASHWIWWAFNGFILAMLALDLGVFHRNSHEVSVREAIGWSVAWIFLALGFNVGLWLWKGPDVAGQFLTGYLIEKSLSVDNIFVFLMIFSHFRVPAICQHKVLFWGVLGALIMRAIFIAVGAAMIARFHWILYVFGAFLVWTGYRMAFGEEKKLDLEGHPFVRAVRRVIPLTADYDGDRFWVLRQGKWVATPLVLVVLVVELTDVIFAVDSIPAIFAVTSDPFIVYTSNVFAILGLRSLYFALSGAAGHLKYLKAGLAAVLAFVGSKMLFMGVVKIPPFVSLAVVVSLLTLSVIASLYAREKRTLSQEAPGVK